MTNALIGVSLPIRKFNSAVSYSPGDSPEYGRSNLYPAASRVSPDPNCCGGSRNEGVNIVPSPDLSEQNPGSQEVVQHKTNRRRTIRASARTANAGGACGNSASIRAPARDRRRPFRRHLSGKFRLREMPTFNLPTSVPQHSDLPQSERASVLKSGIVRVAALTDQFRTGSR
jgi:hypothetical protein